MASGLLVADGRLGARCVTRWCARRSTRPPRASNGAARTGRWPTPWPASATRTARPGIAPPPPTARTTTWSPPSSSSGRGRERRGGYVAALAAYERAAALTRRPGAACGARPSPPPAAPGRAVRPPAPGPCSPRRGRPPTDPLLLGDIARLRGHIEVNIGSATDAHRIFVEAAHAVRDDRPGTSPGDRRRRGDHAHLRRRQRHRRCPRATSSRAVAAGDSPRTRVPQADAGRDDPGGRGELVRRRRSPGPGAARSARRSTTATCCGTSATPPSSSVTTTRSSASTRYALSRAREAGAVTAVIYACSGCASATTSPETWSPCAAAPRRPSRWASAHRAAGDDRSSRWPG